MEEREYFCETCGRRIALSELDEHVLNKHVVKTVETSENETER